MLTPERFGRVEHTRKPAIVCPFCGSKDIIKRGFGRAVPRGGQATMVQRYSCKKCGRRFSAKRKFPEFRYDKNIIRLALKLTEYLGDTKISDVIREVYGVTTTQHTIGRWRKKYSKFRARHKWSKETIEGKHTCLQCGLKATDQEIRGGRLKPCIIS